MAAQADPPSMYNLSNKENHKSKPFKATNVGSSFPTDKSSDNRSHARTAGSLNENSRKVLEHNRARICSNWGLSSLDEAFPPGIRPKKPLGLTAMNHLQRISYTVSLNVARRLFMEECEITKAKEGQEAEWTAVGYSQCRNIDRRVNEENINAAIPTFESVASNRGSLLVASQPLNHNAKLNPFQAKESEAHTKKSKVLTFKVSSTYLQALDTFGLTHIGRENSRNKSHAITNLSHERTTPETHDMSPYKRQRQKGRSRSTGSTSTPLSAGATMQISLENQRRNTELAEQIFGSQEPETLSSSDNEAMETNSATTNDTIIVDCGPVVTPLAVMPPASHRTASEPASLSAICEDRNRNKTIAEGTHLPSTAVSASISADPTVGVTVQVPPTAKTTAPSTHPPHQTLRVYAAGMMSIVRDAWITNLADARRIACTSPEQEELMQEINVAFAVGLDGIDAKIKGIFKRIERE